MAKLEQKIKNPTHSTTPKESLDKDEVTAEESESAKKVKEDTDKLLDDIDQLLDQEAVEKLRREVKDQAPRELTLADLMREGSTVTDQAIGAWTRPSGETCALSAAMLAARARGLA